MNIEEINSLLATGEISKIINTLQNGRETDAPVYDVVSKEIDVDEHKVMKQKDRPDKMVKVDSKSTSDQSGREMKLTGQGTTYRIEKVNRIALALQQLIVKRAVAFCFGNPVDYICNPENTEEELLLQDLKKVLKDIKSTSFDRELATRLFIETECAEIWYLAPKGHDRYSFHSQFQLKCQLVSPSDKSTLYPFFDDYKDLIAFSREYTKKDINMVEHKYFETFTADAHYLWEFSDGAWREVEGYPQENPLGKIPVVYIRQPETEWQVVQGLIDRLEKLLSNFADTNDYHASPKIFVKGNVTGWSKKGESGQIIKGDAESSMQYLSWSQAPEAVRLEIETLLRMIYTITQTPDISFDTMRSIGQVSGTALRLLFMDAHLKVQQKNEIFNSYFQRRVSIITALLAMLNPSYTNARESIGIETELTPYMINDDLTRLQMVMMANGNKPVMSQETSISEYGLSSDPKAEFDKILAESQADNVNDLLEPTM